MMKTTTTTTTNHSNGDKYTLHCEKQVGLWEHKLLPVESAIIMFGQNHPGSDNDGIQKSSNKPWWHWEITIAPEE